MAVFLSLQEFLSSLAFLYKCKYAQIWRILYIVQETMYTVDILGLLIFLDILRVVDTFEYYQGSLFQSQQTGEQPQNRKIHSQPWLSDYDITTMHHG